MELDIDYYLNGTMEEKLDDLSNTQNQSQQNNKILIESSPINNLNLTKNQKRPIEKFQNKDKLDKIHTNLNQENEKIDKNIIILIDDDIESIDEKPPEKNEKKEKKEKIINEEIIDDEQKDQNCKGTVLENKKESIIYPKLNRIMCRKEKESSDGSLNCSRCDFGGSKNKNFHISLPGKNKKQKLNVEKKIENNENKDDRKETVDEGDKKGKESKEKNDIKEVVESEVKEKDHEDGKEKFNGKNRLFIRRSQVKKISNEEVKDTENKEETETTNGKVSVNNKEKESVTSKVSKVSKVSKASKASKVSKDKDKDSSVKSKEIANKSVKSKDGKDSVSIKEKLKDSVKSKEKPKSSVKSKIINDSLEDEVDLNNKKEKPESIKKSIILNEQEVQNDKNDNVPPENLLLQKKRKRQNDSSQENNTSNQNNLSQIQTTQNPSSSIDMPTIINKRFHKKFIHVHSSPLSKNQHDNNESNPRVTQIIENFCFSFENNSNSNSNSNNQSRNQNQNETNCSIINLDSDSDDANKNSTCSNSNSKRNSKKLIKIKFDKKQFFAKPSEIKINKYLNIRNIQSELFVNTNFSYQKEGSKIIKDFTGLISVQDVKEVDLMGLTQFYEALLLFVTDK